MNKQTRQAVLKKIISEHNIEKQSDLINLLKQHDVNATQSTISRDMRELNIIKSHNTNGSSYYRLLNNSVLTSKKLTNEERLISAVSETGVSLNQIEFTNVLTVLPGNGQLIGVLIDSVRQSFDEIVGCIAGDDTILILSKSPEDAAVVNEYFERFLFPA
ncbi:MULTISPECIES: arginine repressor [Enterococcaceae]|uniref:arginine repressor n=1 Tax=Enterococcaceae TaxID=81852 RepID=UPI000E4BBBEF|nr:MULTISPECIES: ArgR family transcriptional regulator [Enterococcaceae]MCI0131009.1 ArgR family transcriptional regulator [Vagococcus sp. CY53-2]RGI29366.1 ArgR family transcriptional regulator [Melissococcus sp. OM08-11BH]UNM89417.1 ArgR family transcriptional regulator [Vagococcus sp. CY52-2]